jgi:hypothetical protein
MTVTVEQLREYVGTAEDSQFVEDCLTMAIEWVNSYIGTKTVPQSVIDLSVLNIASEEFHRRSAPNGVAQFAAMDGAPVRVALDPSNHARRLLERYVGFAV